MKQCFTALSCHQCAARPVCCIKKIDFSSQFTRDTSQFPAPSTNLILTVIIRCIAELHQRFWQAKMPGFSRQTYCISTENVCEYIAQIPGHVKKSTWSFWSDISKRQFNLNSYSSRIDLFIFRRLNAALLLSPIVRQRFVTDIEICQFLKFISVQ